MAYDFRAVDDVEVVVIPRDIDPRPAFSIVAVLPVVDTDG